MTDIDPKIGRRLKALRVQRGQTIERVAERIGASFQAVHTWEIGRVQLTVPRLVALARHYKVTTDYLLFGQDGTGKPAATFADEFLADKRGVRLARAFLKIVDQRNRDAVVGMAEKMAELDRGRETTS